MSALGVMLVGFGILTVWSGLDATNVFDVLRTFVGAPAPARDRTGKLSANQPGLTGAKIA